MDNVFKKTTVLQTRNHQLYLDLNVLPHHPPNDLMTLHYVLLQALVHHTGLASLPSLLCPPNLASPFLVHRAELPEMKKKTIQTPTPETRIDNFLRQGIEPWPPAWKTAVTDHAMESEHWKRHYHSGIREYRPQNVNFASLTPTSFKECKMIKWLGRIQKRLPQKISISTSISSGQPWRQTDDVIEKLATESAHFQDQPHSHRQSRRKKHECGLFSGENHTILDHDISHIVFSVLRRKQNYNLYTVFNVLKANGKGLYATERVTQVMQPGDKFMLHVVQSIEKVNEAKVVERTADHDQFPPRLLVRISQRAWHLSDSRRTFCIATIEQIHKINGRSLPRPSPASSSPLSPPSGVADLVPSMDAADAPVVVFLLLASNRPLNFAAYPRFAIFGRTRTPLIRPYHPKDGGTVVLKHRKETLPSAGSTNAPFRGRGYDVDGAMASIFPTELQRGIRGPWAMMRVVGEFEAGVAPVECVLNQVVGVSGGARSSEAGAHSSAEHGVVVVLHRLHRALTHTPAWGASPTDWSHSYHPITLQQTDTKPNMNL
ncbi:hypothetical protein C0J52_19689 [Blattella germanica]|nr:hypothetical protein C0J52_19689 [Blattella germanica]